MIITCKTAHGNGSYENFAHCAVYLFGEKAVERSYIADPIQGSVFLCVHSYYWRCRAISELMINEEIRDKEVRLIDENGEQLGVVSVKEAMNLAQEKNLDLVKIAPQSKPPVCKIMNYGKYRFDQMKKEKEAKKKQKTMEVKEVRLSPNIDDHDLETKQKNAAKFLEKGDKVKVSVRFRGREMTHTEIGREVLNQFAEGISDVGAIDKAPKMEGRSMVMFLMPKR